VFHPSTWVIEAGQDHWRRGEFHPDLYPPFTISIVVRINSDLIPSTSAMLKMPKYTHQHPFTNLRLATSFVCFFGLPFVIIGCVGSVRYARYKSVNYLPIYVINAILVSFFSFFPSLGLFLHAPGGALCVEACLQRAFPILHLRPMRHLR
jgi:hypothetical protein